MQTNSAQDEEECSICLDQLYTKESDVIVLSCSKKHAYHIDCLYDWKKKGTYATCPNCRNMLVRVPNSPAHFGNYHFKKNAEFLENLCSCVSFLSSFFDE